MPQAAVQWTTPRKSTSAEPTPPAVKLFLFDVQRFCLHDGPGIRTVIFFKGCPLHCRWCQNPESINVEPEMVWYAERCRHCLICAAACPQGAILAGGSRIERSRCDACGNCVDVCPHEALRRVGWLESPQQLLAELLNDKAYFDQSGGGVTLSGGEPLIQLQGALTLLELCQKAGLHTVLETCGAVPWSSVAKVLEVVDQFYFDLKETDEQRHKQLTGVSLAHVLHNAEQLVAAGAKVSFRLPVIPGYTDHAATIEGIAALLQRLGQPQIRLLPYHAGGESKLPRLQSTQQPLGISTSDAEEALDRVTRQLKKSGIAVIVEGRSEGNGHSPRAAGEKTSVFSERVWRLHGAVQSAPPTVCAERALLITDFFRRRADPREPMIIQKARALLRLMQKRKAIIYDDELLVGCFSSKRVGGSIFPELHGIAVLEDLLAFPRREVNPLQIEAQDQRALATHVLPYWVNRFLGRRAFPLPKALHFMYSQLQGKEYVINETGGISHFVPDYATLLARGTVDLAQQARTYAAETQDPDRQDFYQAVEIACLALEELAAAYARRAQELARVEGDAARQAELQQIALICERVPRLPAQTLQEAFQSLLFAQIALNQESLDNAVSPGRLDQILFPYYQADRTAGRIDDQQARDLVACFTVKMSEIIPVFSRRITRYHGGLFNGQVATVGGTDRQGRDATNQLTWFFLEAMDELRLRQPNYHARFHAGSPPDYVKRIATMLRRGSGAPSLINDEVVVPMLVDRETALEDARDYSPVGCVEPVACNATFGSTDAALVNLAICLERALGTKSGGAATPPISRCQALPEVIELLRIQIEAHVRHLISDLQAIERANATYHPTPLTSLLIRGCLKSGIDSTQGGATYNGSGVQGVGVIDIADSLAAIEHVVFQHRLCTMRTLFTALKHDFAGDETLRGHLLQAPKFGNQDPTVDRLANLVMGLFADALAGYENTRGGPYWAGFYSVTAHRAFGENTGALPSGRKAGAPLANGLSPENGFDRLGPTSMLNSVASLDLRGRARNGMNLNLKLDPSSLAGQAGISGIEGLVRGYFQQGGMQLQLNIMDPALLLEARDNPEKYPWLLVRVSGYSAYFNDLSPQMKQEIIDRSLHCGA